jgi:hypothetical protein
MRDASSDRCDIEGKTLADCAENTKGDIMGPRSSLPSWLLSNPHLLAKSF